MYYRLDSETVCGFCQVHFEYKAEVIIHLMKHHLQCLEEGKFTEFDEHHARAFIELYRTNIELGSNIRL